MNKAVVYARVSAEDRNKLGVSIDKQKKDCIEFASKNGYHVSKIFVDDGKSGKNLERPDIQDLIAYCKKKQNNVKAVVVWRLDRISRSNTDYHGILKPLFVKNDIQLLIATEANVDTLEGDLMRNIGINFAEYERKVIAARTVAALKQKAEQGDYPSLAPIGYLNVTNPNGSKAIVIDENRAIYVRRAFELYDSGLYSLNTLTKKLQEDGFKNQNGKAIPCSTVEYMLKNIFYTGSYKYMNKIYDNGKHKAIISKALFYRVQDRLRDPNKSKKHNLEFAYTGLMHCGHCGCQITAENKRDRQGNYRYVYYHCTGYKGGTCKQDYINEEKVDRAFAEVLKLIVIPKEMRDTIADDLREEHLKKLGYTKEVKATLKRQIEQLENRIENSIELKLDGNISHEDWVRFNKKWQDEKERFLIQLQTINDLEKQFYDDTGIMLGFLDNIHDLFIRGTMHQRKKIINIIAEAILYKDKHFDIKLRPFFQDLVKNQLELVKKNSKYRNVKTTVLPGVETTYANFALKNSPGWTRTNNLPVNSRLLRH